MLQNLLSALCKICFQMKFFAVMSFSVSQKITKYEEQLTVKIYLHPEYREIKNKCS